jgi:hypothetical protein
MPATSEFPEEADLAPANAQSRERSQDERRARQLAPDAVELVLVLREHPALGDTPVTETIQPMSPPLESHTAAGGPSGCDDEPVLIVRQHIMDGDLERSLDELAPPTNVLHHPVDSPVFPRDCVHARDMPDDIGLDLGERTVVARGPRLVLSAEKRLVRMHAATLSDARRGGPDGSGTQGPTDE